MSCGCNNNYGGGWGGCGCANTVQYAPPACNPNFPTSCYPLGVGVIQRVVGEDSASCKYTVPTLASNSILFYNASTALVNWADASVSNPIFLGNGSTQATANSGKLQATTPTGQLVALTPSTSAETQFPIVSPSGTTTTWGTIESIVPSQGLVYKNNAGTVVQLTGNSSQVVSFDANGNPVATNTSSLAGASVPPGAVLPFAYNVTTGSVPAGWLLCDGAVYTTSTYPSLGALLGNTYGGSTGTFAVPNLSGLFIRGSGTQTIGGVSYASDSIGTVQADAFQGHKHSYGNLGGSSNQAGSTGPSTWYTNTNPNSTTGPITDGVHGEPRSNSNETRPVNLAMVYCIKT
jgi:microcystin-dependent protein